MKPQFGLKSIGLAFLIGTLAGIALFNPDSFPTTTPAPPTQTTEPKNSIRAYFCPTDPCLDELVNQMDQTTTTLDILAYAFTHNDIADAVLAAQQRGVRIRIVFDRGQAANAYSVDENLENAGIELKRHSPPGRGILHDKVMILDRKTVITGSFNFTKNAAENNNENLLIIHDPTLAAAYQTEFETIWNAG